MIYKDLLELAQKHYDSIQDAPDVEPAIMMAGFAAEFARAEMERADNLQQERDEVRERLSWILAACTIDRDAKHEIEGLLK